MLVPDSLISSRPEGPLLVALSIGLLIGIERERRKLDFANSGARSGIRTFAIVALLASCTAAVGSIALTVGVAVALLVTAVSTAAVREGLDDVTSHAALATTYVLGVLAHSRPSLALEGAILTTALLAFRVPLHEFVRRKISAAELLDALVIGVAALVVLPLLPNRPIDPLGLFNPVTYWRLAVVTMLLGYAGRIVQRAFAGRYALLVYGLASGFVSATAAVALYGKRATNAPHEADFDAAGALAALVGSLCYLALVVATVAPALTMQLLWSFLVSLAGVLAVLLAIGWRHRDASDHGELPPAEAFGYRTVVVFVALVALFSVIAELATRLLGRAGAFVGVTLMGTADAHAAAISMAALLDAGQTTVATAKLGVLFALTANAAVKIPTAFVFGTRRYGALFTLGALLLVAGLWIGVLLPPPSTHG